MNTFLFSDYLSQDSQHTGWSWLFLLQSGVTRTIIGAKTPGQLQSNIHSTALALTVLELEELNAVSQPDAIYPNWMVAPQMADRFPVED